MVDRDRCPPWVKVAADGQLCLRVLFCQLDAATSSAQGANEQVTLDGRRRLALRGHKEHEELGAGKRGVKEADQVGLLQARMKCTYELALLASVKPWVVTRVQGAAEFGEEATTDWLLSTNVHDTANVSSNAVLKAS